MPAEHKLQKPFDFVNQAKLEFSCNELPEVSDKTYAFWRRWLILRWSEDFTGREDRFLSERLWDELPGILNWALEGLRVLEREGDFPKTATAEAMMEDWKRHADSLYWFISETVEVDAKSSIVKALFYEAYAGFCEAHNARIKDQARVGEEIKTLLPSVRLERPRKDEGRREYEYAGIRWKVGVSANDAEPQTTQTGARQDVLKDTSGPGGLGGLGETYIGQTTDPAVQHPDRMFGLEWALITKRWNPTKPVTWVVEDAVKEYRSKFNKDPDVDQLTAGVIKGMKPEGSP